MSTSIAPVAVTESSADDLASLRYLLDLALQPIDDFTGFTRLEQIGGSALRYQLSYAGYALSMAQYTRTPAFGGYLAEAQANLIRKMCDKRVWGYWATEQLAGYLRWNPDPMTFGNVMYTGFFAAMLALYESLNGTGEFDDPGSLELRWSTEKSFHYGYAPIAEAIARNMRQSRQTLYPCEPHLIYPMCNAVAMVGLCAYDRLHHRDLAGDLPEKMRQSLFDNKFRRRDGRFVFGRGPLGLVFPPMIANDAVMTYWLNALTPDLAHDTWDTLRRTRIRDRSTRIGLRTTPVDHLDVGSYRPGDGWAWANLLIAAHEMGDTEVADTITEKIAADIGLDHSPHGAHKLHGVSTWVNCAHVLGRMTRPDGMRDLASGEIADAWRHGPHLDSAGYPDVLVAKALTDGTTLQLVLRPGAGPTRTALRLSRLRPSATYALRGAISDEVTADHDGRAIIEVDLSARLEVQVRPHV
ncbi:hypothetical protein [Gordonia sp. N1V]|uniref:linalool dehydratase/isomerase domain-containing protein n=1 Tax=Gordonia sp. N1V TaxID=3034163 RepID=UPI0023E1C283|nr:hypothetical protein [Gordonia sp. N1V]MDF3280102.1 hypothetical protein [Gordonia sp. N1V]